MCFYACLGLDMGYWRCCGLHVSCILYFDSEECDRFIPVQECRVCWFTRLGNVPPT